MKEDGLHEEEILAARGFERWLQRRRSSAAAEVAYWKGGKGLEEEIPQGGKRNREARRTDESLHVWSQDTGERRMEESPYASKQAKELLRRVGSLQRGISDREAHRMDKGRLYGEEGLQGSVLDTEALCRVNGLLDMGETLEGGALHRDELREGEGKETPKRPNERLRSCARERVTKP
jgi:hypothetical protein